MEKNYNFGLVYQKFSKKKLIISSLIKSLIFVFIAMLLVGYFLGYRIYNVMGYSSEPDIHYGSVVVDYKVPFKELKVGDYITWSRTGNSFVTHVIIEIDYENNSITTSQTNHFDDDGIVSPDTPIKYENVYGKVIFTIPKLGSVFVGIKNLILTGRSINILGIMTIVLTITAIQLFGSFIKKEYYIIKE